MAIATGSQAPAPTAAGANTENTPAPSIAPAPMAAASMVPRLRCGLACGPEEVVNGVSLCGQPRGVPPGRQRTRPVPAGPVGDCVVPRARGWVRRGPVLRVWPERAGGGRGTAALARAGAGLGRAD